MDNISIIDYRPELATFFNSLNLAWVEKYFEVEDGDREVLGNPQAYIISKGGYIFFAESGDEIAGTFALIKKDSDTYELAKMAVAEKWQGKKIGNLMIQFCIDKAKKT